MNKEEQNDFTYTDKSVEEIVENFYKNQTRKIYTDILNKHKKSDNVT